MHALKPLHVQVGLPHGGSHNAAVFVLLSCNKQHVHHCIYSCHADPCVVYWLRLMEGQPPLTTSAPRIHAPTK
jgi:hypothetical protein